MSRTDLRDFTPEVTIHLYGTRPITISMEKLGGGTIGRRYAGTWRYVVTWGSQETIREQALETVLPVTHLDAARVLAHYLSAYADPNSGYDGPNLPTGSALAMCRAEHQTFTAFALEAEDDTPDTRTDLGRAAAFGMSAIPAQNTGPADELHITTPFGRHGFARSLARTAAKLDLVVDYSHNGRWIRRTHRLRVAGRHADTFCQAVMHVLDNRDTK